MIENTMMEALAKKYEAKRAEALATLEVYMENPVGVGEHSDLMHEYEKWVEVLEKADSMLETIGRHYYKHRDAKGSTVGGCCQEDKDPGSFTPNLTPPE